jgi:hypothetical protein
MSAAPRRKRIAVCHASQSEERAEALSNGSL